ncbi:MAG TPA: hypothetical protein VG944_16030 [Fimbriimonas sp.]|nr:hypothetical protein [Fimbriimonas sp.]
MSVLLPLACLAILVISLFLQRDKAGSSPPAARWFFVLVTAGVTLFAARRFGEATEFPQLLIGFGLGAGAGILALLLDRLKPHESATIALAAGCASVVLLLNAKDVVNACLAIPVGAAMVAMLLPTRTGGLAAVVLSCVALSEVMGTFRQNSFVFPSAGPVIATAIAMLSLAGLAMEKMAPKFEKFWPPVAAVVCVGIAYATAIKYLQLESGWLALAIAPIAALLVFWLFAGEQGSDVFQLIVATIIWIALGTVAFGMAKGFGITLALVVSTTLLVALKSDRALITAGPLLALALHRVFREMHPEVARSLDIGQHYTLIGLAIGALIPLLPEEWLERLKGVGDVRAAASSALWVLIALATPALIGLFLAPKGLLGFVTGLAFSGFFGAMRLNTKPLVLGFSCGIGTLAILEYRWLGDVTSMTRDDKIHWFLYSAIGLCVIAAVLGLLGRSSRPAALASEAA